MTSRPDLHLLPIAHAAIKAQINTMNKMNHYNMLKHKKPYAMIVASLLSFGMAYADGMPIKTQSGLPSHSGHLVVGDPISPGNGNNYQAFHLWDDHMTAGTQSMSLDLVYNSTVGWNGNWATRVFKTQIPGTSTTYLTLSRPNGQVLHFRNPTVVGGNKIWTGDADNNGVLTENLNSTNGTTTGYTYKRPDNYVETYYNGGVLQSIASPDKPWNASAYNTFTYDGAGKLTKIINNPTGRAVTVTYTIANGQWLQKFTLPSGKTITRAYSGAVNGNGLIKDSTAQTNSITWEDGSITNFGYNANNKLTSVTDELGNVVASWSYDAYGRTLTSQRAGLEQVSVAYNNNSTANITNQDSATSSFSFTDLVGNHKVSSGTVAGVSLSFTYDANGNPASATNGNGVVTTYTYNASNLETTRVVASGTANAKRIDTTWNTSLRKPLTMIEYTDGTNTTISRITTFTYDGKGNVLTRAVTAGANTRTWTYTYNTFSQLLTAKDPLNNITTYTYNNSGITNNFLTQITYPNGFANVFTVNNDHWITSVTDWNNIATTFTYDARGRILTSTKSGMTTSCTYDLAGNLTKVTLPGSVVLTYAYDTGHRLTKISDASGNSINYGYDAMGRVNSVQNKDPSGNLTLAHAYVYDGLGRLIQSTGAANQTTAFSYDNNSNQIQVTDPLNQITTRQFDALNRLTKAIDPTHQTDQTGTLYGYDNYNTLNSVTDPRGLATQYTNDGYGGITQLVSPDTGTSTSTYDANGNVLTRTDAKGQTTTYTYDALNRVKTITYQGGATSTLTYDAGTNGRGHLTGLTDATGTYAYTWNTLGNLTAETRTLNSVAYTTSYGYDTNGRLATVTYPSGRIISYTRDTNGRISQVTSTVGTTVTTLASNITYQPFGGVKSYQLGNGSTYTRSYDQDNRITNYSIATGSRSVGYDLASRLNASADYAAAAPTTPVNVQNYTYDGLDRLTGWTSPNSNQSFTYDSDGNRTSQTIAANTYTYSYPTTSNRLQTTQGPTPAKTYTYDANGSPTTDGTNQYTFDARGRLTQAITALGTVGYGINTYGQRVKKTVGTTTTLYHYDRDGHVIAESTTTGVPAAEYVYLGDTPLAVFR